MAFKRVLMHLRIRKLHQSCICFVFLSLFFVSGQRARHIAISLSTVEQLLLFLPHTAHSVQSQTQKKKVLSILHHVTFKCLLFLHTQSRVHNVCMHKLRREMCFPCFHFQNREEQQPSGREIKWQFTCHLLRLDSTYCSKAKAQNMFNTERRR